MQRVKAHDESVYVLCDEKKFSDIHGVFALTDGHVLFHCLPEKSEQIKNAFLPFLRRHRIFCISGSASESDFVCGCVKEAVKIIPSEVRDYYFMEYTGTSFSDDEKILRLQNAALVKCGKHDGEKLMPLHVEYMQVEVLPQGRKVNAAAERICLDRNLITQNVFAIKKDERFVAKAQTNAVGINTVQIGGVFTERQFRRNGYAGILVRHIARMAHEEGKATVLFVKTQNSTAIHSYEKSGFVRTGFYKIIYFGK